MTFVMRDITVSNVPIRYVNSFDFQRFENIIEYVSAVDTEKRPERVRLTAVRN
jgi:hypothetical protein